MIRAESLPTPFQTRFTNATHSAICDVPREKGGEGQGFGPHELLEAALATCMTMTVQMYASKHGYPEFTACCEVRIDRSRPGTVTLHYSLSFEGDLTAEQVRRLHEAVKGCPVGRTLTGGISIEPDSEGAST